MYKRQVVGSAVAGALSMTFGCTLRAPHGGIFVFPVVDHAALYCVALAVGLSLIHIFCFPVAIPLQKFYNRGTL